MLRRQTPLAHPAPPIQIEVASFPKGAQSMTYLGATLSLLFMPPIGVFSFELPYHDGGMDPFLVVVVHTYYGAFSRLCLQTVAEK